MTTSEPLSPFETGDACLVREGCRNYPAQCWACVWPEEGLRPSEYVPRDPQVEHPLTTQLKKERATRRKAAKQSEASKRGKAARRRGKAFERAMAKATSGNVQPGSGAIPGLPNDGITGVELGSIMHEDKFGLSYPLKTPYDWLEKWDLIFVQGQQTTFVLTTYDRWTLRQWSGLAVGCVTSKQVKTWEDILLDQREKPDVVFASWPRKARVVMQLVPSWIRHMSPAPVDLKKLAEAMRLLEEAIR